MDKTQKKLDIIQIILSITKKSIPNLEYEQIIP